MASGLAEAIVQSNPYSDLEALLRGEIPHFLDADWVIKANLAAYVYRILPASHPAKSQLKHQRMLQEARHQMIKSQLLPLLQAWAEAGLKAVLLKGFALAEFVYTSAGERHYGDVDILIDEKDSKMALQIAQGMGWIMTYNRQEHWVPYRHEEAHLFSPDESIRIDLHRKVVKQDHWLDSGRRYRFTQAVWARAVRQNWEKTSVWLLEPVDFLLVGLLIHRVVGDGWGRKIHDLLDAKMLVEHYGLTKEQILERAEQLGCKRTALLAIQTCDPWLNQVKLGMPSDTGLHELERQTQSELGWPILERLANRIWYVGMAVRLWTPAIVELWQIKKRLKASGDLYVLLQGLEPQLSKPQPDNLKPLSEITFGVKNALRILGPRTDGCVPRSLTLYKMLREKGYEVEFVSGVRRDEGKLTGHAWIEHQGRPVEGFYDEAAPQLYKENFRYPKKQLK